MTEEKNLKISDKKEWTAPKLTEQVMELTNNHLNKTQPGGISEAWYYMS